MSNQFQFEMCTLLINMKPEIIGFSKPKHNPQSTILIPLIHLEPNSPLTSEKRQNRLLCIQLSFDDRPRGPYNLEKGKQLQRYAKFLEA